MGGTLHPPSNIYVRSFLYVLYTLMKLYYTKTLSDQALSLAPDWTLLLQRPRIPVSFRVQQQPFSIILEFYSLQVWSNNHWAKSRCCDGFIPFLRQQRKIASWPFPVSRGTRLPRLKVLVLCLKVSNGRLSFSHLVLLWPPLCLSLPHLKTLAIPFGPIR